jgi:hypothetical protein
MRSMIASIVLCATTLVLQHSMLGALAAKVDAIAL